MLLNSISGSPSHHNLFNTDPHESMDTNDPFEHFNSLGGGLGLSGFGPQVRPGNTPFRSHSFNIGGHRAGGGPGLGQKVYHDRYVHTDIQFDHNTSIDVT